MKAFDARHARTSGTDPLRIDTVATTEAGGCLGITFCPGKHSDSVFGRPWRRDLDTDIRAIVDWGAAGVISLIEPDEMRRLGVSRLGDAVVAAGLQWLHWPITDLSAPDGRFAAGWAREGPGVLAGMQGGQRWVVHCRGGLGRAGTVAAYMLVQTGVPPGEAIRRVRAARPGAIETAAQVAWVMS
jgi:ADP-ribosyl-[dinitrogen reductase] hydrolase